MSRVGLSVVVAAVAGISLTGCSSAVSSNSSAEQLQALKFESAPPGAEIHTPTNQTCKTPCELSVPSSEQLVIITKNNYQPKTVQVTTDSRTQSGPRRAPAGVEAGPPRGRPQIGFQNALCQGRADT